MKLDIHIHSNYSRDGIARPKEILERCKLAGLEGCAITDHNAIEGSLQACSLAKDEGLVVLRGVEVSAEEGHILAYGINELVPKGLSMAETIERIHALGGAAVAAHPHRFPSGIGLEMAKTGKFDAIEVINGGSSRRSNRLARRIAEVRNAPMAAGSDAHEPENIGRAYTIFDTASSESDLIEALLKGRVQPGGRSRTWTEGVRYDIETLTEWLRGGFKRL